MCTRSRTSRKRHSSIIARTRLDGFVRKREKDKRVSENEKKNPVCGIPSKKKKKIRNTGRFAVYKFSYNLICISSVVKQKTVNGVSSYNFTVPKEV